MSATLPIAAGIGIEGIIWLIILIFWGIAQAVQQSRRGKPGSAPPPSRRTPTPIDNEIREMLEQLSGRPAGNATSETRGDLLTDEAEEEMEPPPPPPPPIRRPQPQRPPHIRRAQRQPVFIPPPPIAPAQQPEPAWSVTPAYNTAEIKPMISAEDFAAAGLSLRSGLNAPGISLRMKGMDLRGMAMMRSGGHSRQHGTPTLDLAELRQPATLRKAVLAKAILDPPRALLPYGR